MSELARLDPGTPKKYILPSTKDLPEADQDWVILLHGKMQVADLFAVSDFQSQFAVGLELLTRRIQSWSLTDNGQPAAITLENVSRISGSETVFDDLKYLINQLQSDQKVTNDIETDVKKNEASSVI